MIKSTFRGAKRVLKPLVNVSAWMGWKSLKEDNQRLGRLAKSVLMPTKTVVNPETFEEAVSRLNLNENMIQSRLQYFKRLAALYIIVAIIIFVYAVYLLVLVGTLLGFMMALAILSAVLALAFQQHFWYTQMRERRLGLSFREWFYIVFHIKKGE